jgi:hypothetical protein
MIKSAKVIGNNVDSEEYHNIQIPRGDVTYPMSPSSLKEFAKCCDRWKSGYEPPDSDAKRTGRMLDTFILTPEQFGKRFVVLPENAPRKPSVTQINAAKPSPETVKAIQWWDLFRSKHEGAEIISLEQQVECMTASKRLLFDEVISAYLDASDRQVLVEAEWHDEKTGLVVPVRCLMDLVPRKGTEFEKTAGDYKTVSSANLGAFQRKVFDLGWHVQGAFDLDLLAAATGEDRNTWVWVVQENYAPWQPGKRMMSQAFLEIGRLAYRRALALYCQCLKTNQWPDYDQTDEAIQGWSLVEASPWMENEATFAPKFQFESEEPPPIEIEDFQH